MATWYDIKQGLEQKLADSKKDILANEYPEDRLHEIVDSWIPTHNYTLALLLADNLYLGYIDDTGLVDPSQGDIFKMIQAAIYEALSQIAWEWLDQNRVPEDEDMEQIS